MTVDSGVTPCAINHPTDSPYFNKIAPATFGHGKITSKQVKMAPGTRSGRLSAIFSTPFKLSSAAYTAYRAPAGLAGWRGPIVRYRF
jgi:hypothetical protein